MRGAAFSGVLVLLALSGTEQITFKEFRAGMETRSHILLDIINLISSLFHSTQQYMKNIWAAGTFYIHLELVCFKEKPVIL